MLTMTIGCLGTDHTRASLAQRELLTLSDERLDALLDALVAEPGVSEAAILGTCNRTEIYLAAADIDAAMDHADGCLMRAAGATPDEVAQLVVRRNGGEAARHLCAVAAGLRSLVLGETQILTQVREAFEHAAARGALGGELQALGRAAVRCGKQVRAQTAVGTADTSVSGVVVELAEQHFGSLKGRTALLVGAGRISAVAAELLRSADIGTLNIVSRTRQAAEQLAAAYGGRAGTLDELPVLLEAADLAIAATRAPAPLICPGMLSSRPADRPLRVYDIAVPRNVDPSVGMLPNVTLVDLDGLPGASSAEIAGAGAAWAIVDACVERLAVESMTRRAVPLIASLREHVDRQKDVELSRTLADLGHLPQADQDAVALLAHRLINRMFHHLATRIKVVAGRPDADTYLAALAVLFDGEGTGYRPVAVPQRELAGEDAADSAAELPA
jgi:glutamyl-tRNA reductase